MAFFQGSVHEGIAAALQQAKSVVCFVTDGEAESTQWETEFFAEEDIRSLLQAQAVSLRLEAGSEGESNLAQLYPIPKKPTVVVIRNAELKEYIAPGVSKDEFVRRMKGALPPAQPAPNQPLPAQATGSQRGAAAAVPAAPASQPNRDNTDSRVQALLAERSAKLAERKKKEEEEAKRQRVDKAKAKAEAEASGSKKPDDRSKYEATLKKKQREAREERERIRKAIADDKAARAARKAAAEAERKEAAASEKADPAPFAPASQLLPRTGQLSEHCALQVRLFDGSTIRSRFSSHETLKDVRKWVDETRGSNREAYTFKVLLTPLPSKTIDTTEENKSLQALGLVPSSTLILLRVPKYSAAYSSGTTSVADGAQGNAFQGFIDYILALITGFFSSVVAFFSTLLNTAGPPTAVPEPSHPQVSQSQAASDAALRRRGGRIRGLDHTGGQPNDQQFYNGNSTNFEPRSDDGE
ncbi:UBX-domain-containing protein [Parathielavia hyrcaniae]|uniref:UBX domain-containing protein 2 n=1 Tax=Parathielavia hyrcaniae TaxID=113614 RepID=A0AAN6Q213_9PEZI|nr:UBX-domain-containing protein [Parathielavia hyrcaniae]